MTHRRARTFLKLLPVTAILASTHIALAATPAAPPAQTGTGTVESTPTVQPTLQTAVLPATPATPAPQEEPQAQPVATPPDIDPRQVECVAKIVVHEAGNQPLRGRQAVAQVIRTRINDGRFGSDACSVARQRGQFFDVDSYHPSRTSAQWTDAVEIAQATLKGEGADVVPGALFFHSGSAGFSGRTRLARVADHVFYR